MKGFLILMVAGFLACKNTPSYKDFSNKEEAANLTISGLKEGRWIEYEDSAFDVSEDSNSPYFALIVYKAGKPYGLTKWYYKSGKLLSEIPHTNGQINGIMKLYYESGNLKQTVLYTNGNKNGTEKIYYENGQIKTEFQFADNKKNGVTKQYYENGKLKAEASYRNDKINGIGKGYYNNGNLMVETQYKDGERLETTLFDSTGHEIK